MGSKRNPAFAKNKLIDDYAKAMVARLLLSNGAGCYTPKRFLTRLPTKFNIAMDGNDRTIQNTVDIGQIPTSLVIQDAIKPIADPKNAQTLSLKKDSLYAAPNKIGKKIMT